MMRRSLAVLTMVILGACGPSIEGSEEPEVLERAVWSPGPPTTRGPMTAVCIPLEEQGECLRITLVMQTSGEPSHVAGAVVGPDCAADDAALTRVDGFDGVATTGHGVLWLTGTAQLDDQSQLDLDIEAEQGECEI